jgi:hypothetical protein
MARRVPHAAEGSEFVRSQVLTKHNVKIIDPRTLHHMGVESSRVPATLAGVLRTAGLQGWAVGDDG